MDNAALIVKKAHELVSVLSPPSGRTHGHAAQIIIYCTLISTLTGTKVSPPTAAPGLDATTLSFLYNKDEAVKNLRQVETCSMITIAHVIIT